MLHVLQHACLLAHVAHADHGHAAHDHVHVHADGSPHVHHKCIHDKIHKEYERYATVTPQTYSFQHGAQGEHAERNPHADGAAPSVRKLRKQWGSAEDMTWEPIRFALDTSLMASSSTDAAYTCSTSSSSETVDMRGYQPAGCRPNWVLSSAARTMLTTRLLPDAKKWVEQALKVERVSGTLELKSTSSPYGTGIPGVTTSNSRKLQNTDMLLVVTARPIADSQDCTTGCTLATGGGIEFDNFGRSIAGHLNFNPAASGTFADESKYQQNLHTAIHEIMHSLGLGPFSKMLDEELNPRANSVVTTQPYNGFASFTRSFVASPRVKQAVRRQFKCGSVPGAEIENDGGSGSAGSHWEKRVFGDETMTASVSDNPITTELTFAFFEDSGHYRASYNMVSVSEWGLHMGCKFPGHDGTDCSEWGKIPGAAKAYAVTTSDGLGNNKFLCTTDGKGKAMQKVTGCTGGSPWQCHGGFLRSNDNYMDKCPIASPYRQCTHAWTHNPPFAKESSSASARCFEANMIGNGYTGGSGGSVYCFDHSCAGNVLKITIPEMQYQRNNQPTTNPAVTISCPSAGGSMTVSGYTGHVTCPSYAEMCEDEAAVTAHEAKMKQAAALLFQATVPQDGGPGGGTAVRVYGQGFSSGAVTVKFGGTDATGVKVISNNELLATTPPHSAGEVDVVVATSTDTDTGYGAFTYDSAVPDGDRKDALSTFTYPSTKQGFSGSTSTSGMTGYKITRGGHGTNAGPLAVVIFSAKTASSYGAVFMVARDGDVASPRHHSTTLPAVNSGLYRGGNAKAFVLGGDGSCGTGDGNTYLSAGPFNGFGASTATAGWVAQYTFQHLEPKDMTTLDWDGGGTAEHTVSFSNNCGASNTGSTCSVYTAIQYVRLKGLASSCKKIRLKVSRGSGTGDEAAFFQAFARQGRIPTELLYDQKNSGLFSGINLDISSFGSDDWFVMLTAQKSASNCRTAASSCMGATLSVKVQLSGTRLLNSLDSGSGCSTKPALKSCAASTKAPVAAATKKPTTAQPTTTKAPTSKAPTSKAPTRAAATEQPTKATTKTPTEATTKQPTREPTTKAPTSKAPTRIPTTSPTNAPSTRRPTPAPTAAPATRKPTKAGDTHHPTKLPTARPTNQPTASPTTEAPTPATATEQPTAALTRSPTTAVITTASVSLKSEFSGIVPASKFKDALFALLSAAGVRSDVYLTAKQTVRYTYSGAMRLGGTVDYHCTGNACRARRYLAEYSMAKVLGIALSDLVPTWSKATPMGRRLASLRQLRRVDAAILAYSATSELAAGDTATVVKASAADAAQLKTEFMTSYNANIQADIAVPASKGGASLSAEKAIQSADVAAEAASVKTSVTASIPCVASANCDAKSLNTKLSTSDASFKTHLLAAGVDPTVTSTLTATSAALIPTTSAPTAAPIPEDPWWKVWLLWIVIGAMIVFIMCLASCAICCFCCRNSETAKNDPEFDAFAMGTCADAPRGGGGGRGGKQGGNRAMTPPRRGH